MNSLADKLDGSKMKNTRVKAWSVGVILMGCAALGLLAKSSSSQPAKSQASAVGRYQLQMSPQGLNPYVMLLDTKTGRCWVKSSPAATNWDESTPSGLGR